MRPGGVLLLLAGVWVLAQVLSGDALPRLGVVTRPDDSRLGDGIEVPVPDDGYGDGYRDGSGRPL